MKIDKTLALKVLELIIKILTWILDEADETGAATGDEIEHFLFPMEYLRVTADEKAKDHKGGYAYDFAGKDTGSDELYAPCEMVVKRIRENRNGEVYFESTQPVLFADGTQDYARMLLMHDPDAAELYSVGDIVQQGDYIYSEGGMGAGDRQMFANHVHIEVGKGKWKSLKHLQLSNGNFSIENPEPPEKMFWVPIDCIIYDSYGKDWKVLKK